jgi:hypothetical protein
MTAFGLAAVLRSCGKPGGLSFPSVPTERADTTKEIKSLMEFKSKAAVAVSGALTAGAFATLAAAIPAGAAVTHSGTEQSEAGVVFAVGSNLSIVGAGHIGQNTEFSRSQRGHTVTFSAGNNRCVTDGSGGLSLQHCDNSRSQKFDEVGYGPYVALWNEGSHQYVTEHGTNRRVTTDNVRRDRRGHLDFSRAQEWKWTTFNVGRPGPGGGGNGGGNPNPGRSVTARATTRIVNHPDGGHGATKPIWAEDTINRTVTIKLMGPADLSNCGGGVAHCYYYTGTLSDNGTFAANVGNDAPNQSGHWAGSEEVNPQARGTMIGGAPEAFYASSNHPEASLVDHYLDNHGTPASGDETTSAWVEQFFPASTHFGSVGLPSYKWTYTTTNLRRTQQWVDSTGNNDGNSPQDGNITG